MVDELESCGPSHASMWMELVVHDINQDRARESERPSTRIHRFSIHVKPVE